MGSTLLLQLRRRQRLLLLPLPLMSITPTVYVEVAAVWQRCCGRQLWLVGFCLSMIAAAAAD